MISPDGVAHLVKTLNGLKHKESVRIEMKYGAHIRILAMQEGPRTMTHFICVSGAYARVQGNKWETNEEYDEIRRRGKNFVSGGWIDLGNAEYWEFESALEEE